MNTLFSNYSGFLALFGYWTAIIVAGAVALYLLKVVPQSYRRMNLQTRIIVSWITLITSVVLCWRYEFPWIILLFAWATRSKIPISPDIKVHYIKRWNWEMFFVLMTLGWYAERYTYHTLAILFKIFAWISVLSPTILSDYLNYRGKREEHPIA